MEFVRFFRGNSAPLSSPENLFFFASSVVLLSYILKFTKSREKEKALKPLSFKAFSVVDDTGLEKEGISITAGCVCPCPLISGRFGTIVFHGGA